MTRLTPIRIEWNNWNAFMFEILGVEIRGYERALFAIYLSKRFFTLDILFFNITIKSPKL